MTGRHSSRLSSRLWPRPPRLPVRALGLDFANPVGLAAGFDRTGRLAPYLGLAGFGAVEVGTVTAAALAGDPGLPSRLHRARHRGVRIGVNFGSSHDGFGPEACSDYVAALRAAWPHADYLVANLSAPWARHRRVGDPTSLLELLRLERDRLAAESGRRVPLAVKVPADGGDIPAAALAARACALDGVVLVSASARTVNRLATVLESLPVISVGGVTTADEARDRLAAGAVLVQVYTAFARGSPFIARRIVGGLKVAAGRLHREAVT